MPRYIDAEKIDLGQVSDSICQWQAENAIDDTPTADVVEVKRGKWEIACDPKYWQYTEDRFYCSNCNGTNNYKTKYCPNCGADMRERRDDGKT